MKRILTLFSKKETTDIAPMKTTQYGTLKTFNEVADIIDDNLKQSYTRKYKTS